MEITAALAAFDALSQETRLAAFRLLVRAGPDGVPAGEVARELGVPQNTMSSHLAQLARAGLVSSERDGRHVVYRVEFGTVRALTLYLLEDCCNGRAEVCRPVVDSLKLRCS